MDSGSRYRALGFDRNLVYAAGELLTNLDEHRNREFTRAEMHEQVDWQLADEHHRLPIHFTSREVGGREAMHELHDRALDLLIEHRMLELDEAGALHFVIAPGLGSVYTTDPALRAAGEVRHEAARAVLESVGMLPAGTLVRTDGEVPVRLKRAVNIRTAWASGWDLSTRSISHGLLWSPPTVTYAGQGGRWRQAWAVGPLADMLAAQIAHAHAEVAA